MAGAPSYRQVLPRSASPCVITGAVAGPDPAPGASHRALLRRVPSAGSAIDALSVRPLAPRHGTERQARLPLAYQTQSPRQSAKVASVATSPSWHQESKCVGIPATGEPHRSAAERRGMQSPCGHPSVPERSRKTQKGPNGPASPQCRRHEVLPPRPGLSFSSPSPSFPPQV